jgi:hypothetical protein
MSNPNHCMQDDGELSPADVTQLQFQSYAASGL